MTKKILTTLAFGLAVTLPSFATTITLAPGGFTGAPGSNTVPSNGSTFAGLTLVADTGVQTLVNGPGSDTNATADERVYRTGTGTLDFFVQVDNLQGAGVDNLRTVDVRNFTGFTTAVAYRTNSGTVPPSDANRTTTGDTINFGFLNATDNSGTLGVLPPDGLGSTSYWLEIDTNATAYMFTGQVGVIDGGTASIVAYSPAAGVPEPMTAGLLGGGLALLGVARWRKAAKKA